MNYRVRVGSLRARHKATKAVKAASQFGAAQRGRSGRSSLKACLNLRRIHSVYLERGQVCLLVFSNDVSFRWFPAPPFAFPFHSLPFTRTSSFHFHFMSFCLHVPSSHSVPSFARTTARPLACTRATCLQPRFQVAQVLPMRSGSLVVPAHLVSLHHNHTVWSCLVTCLLLMSSSFRLLCARTRTFVRP